MLVIRLRIEQEAMEVAQEAYGLITRNLTRTSLRSSRKGFLKITVQEVPSMLFVQRILTSLAVVLVFCLPLSAGAAVGRTPVGAMQVAGTKVHNAKVIALGLTTRKFTAFAKRYGAKKWDEWTDAGLTKASLALGAAIRGGFGTVFQEVAKKADVILFHLPDMNYTSVGNIPISFNETYRLTEAELGTVLSTPELLRKTTFFDEKGEVLLEEVMERYYRPGQPDPERFINTPL